MSQTFCDRLYSTAASEGNSCLDSGRCQWVKYIRWKVRNKWSSYGHDIGILRRSTRSCTFIGGFAMNWRRRPEILIINFVQLRTASLAETLPQSPGRELLHPVVWLRCLNHKIWLGKQSKPWSVSSQPAFAMQVKALSPPLRLKVHGKQYVIQIGAWLRKQLQTKLTIKQLKTKQ